MPGRPKSHVWDSFHVHNDPVTGQPVTAVCRDCKMKVSPRLSRLVTHIGSCSGSTCSLPSVPSTQKEVFEVDTDDVLSVEKSSVKRKKNEKQLTTFFRLS